MTKPADKPGSVVDSHSSGPRITPTAQATYPRARREASALAYLVLLPVEVAAFHPCRDLRQPSVAARRDAVHVRTRLCGPIRRFRSPALSGKSGASPHPSPLRDFAALRRRSPATLYARALPVTVPCGARTFLHARSGVVRRRLNPHTAAAWPASSPAVYRAEGFPTASVGIRVSDTGRAFPGRRRVPC